MLKARFTTWVLIFGTFTLFHSSAWSLELEKKFIKAGNRVDDMPVVTEFSGTVDARNVYRTYIPFNTLAGQAKHNIYGKRMPLFSDDPEEAVLKIPVNIKDDEDAIYYVVSKVTDTSWRVLKAKERLLVEDEKEMLELTVYLDEQRGGCQDPVCTYPQKGQKFSTSFNLYVFKVDPINLYRVNNTTNFPILHPKGFFLDVYLSSQTYENAAPLIKGLESSESERFNVRALFPEKLKTDIHATYIFNYWNDDLQGTDLKKRPVTSFGDAVNYSLRKVKFGLGALQYQELPFVRDSYAQNIAISLVDKYMFSTPISTSVLVLRH